MASLMAKLYEKSFCLLSGLVVPFLTLLAPSWLTVSGVGPCWAVLWLLPWAIEDGQISALLAGLCLGLLLDGISLGTATHVPALMALGWWWGGLGRRGKQIEGIFSLGLLSWIGTVLFGISLWLQMALMQIIESGQLLISWGVYTLFSQALITSILAPVIYFSLIAIWRRKSAFNA